MKKRVIKSINIIISTLIIIIGINFFRNYMILKERNSNILKYVDNTNYHVIETINRKNQNEVRDTYKKGDKTVTFLEINSRESGQVKISRYKTGDKVNSYNLTNKTASLGSETYQSSEPLFSDDDSISFTECLFSIINKAVIEDKECYRIQTVFENDFVVIFEKETGLPIESIIDDTIVKMKYEFGKVEDSIFIEPDLSEYVIERE